LNISWDVVSVILLLCQGLIFQNDSEIEGLAVSFLGITMVLILLGTLLFCMAKLLRDIVRNEKAVLISKVAMSRYPQDLQQEIMREFSTHEVERTGQIVLLKDEFEKMHPDLKGEILGILDQEFKLGNEAFAKAAEDIRNRREMS
jgi:hypothetical protein